MSTDSKTPRKKSTAANYPEKWRLKSEEKEALKTETDQALDIFTNLYPKKPD